MGGKWLSGRKRQTVNLLGNSRWFESNLSHSLNKKEKNIISNIKYYNINTIRPIKFNVVNKTIYIRNVNAINNEYLFYIIKENAKYNILNKYIKNINESTDCIGSTNYIVIARNVIKIG